MIGGRRLIIEQGEKNNFIENMGKKGKQEK